VSEAAKFLGVSPNTVKTHLKAVFEKTGVDRQAGLVRKIAQMLAAMGHH
jgi:DNA-binding CsgD family transcriptional regulator